MKQLTQERLKECLHYDKETGIFTWKVAASPRAAIGSVAGCSGRNGYVLIGIDGRHYFAHRLAYLYVTGSFPPHVMDHINRVRDDNRWENLRACEQVNNRSNSRAKGPSGYKNVIWDKSRAKWMVNIVYKGKSHFVGRFADKAEAALAYNKKASEVLGEYAYLNDVMAA